MKNKNINQKFKKTVLISALLLELGSGAQAAIINVNDLCTLNEAVETANSGNVVGDCIQGEIDAPDVIELPADAVIGLTSVAYVNSEITINANNSTIYAGVAPPFQLFYVENSSGFTLNDANVTGGFAPNNIGGGVFAYNSNVNINRSTISTNRGGGVFLVNSTGTINSSVVKENFSAGTQDYSGGGITILGGDVSITDSTINGNNSDTTDMGGGGITVRTFYGPAVLSVINTTISGNTSSLGGGGIQGSSNNYGSAITVTLSNVTIVDNHASGVGVNGGGISSEGGQTTITINQSLISGNTATGFGGAEIDNVGGGTVTVDNFNLFGLDGTSGLAGVIQGVSDIVPVMGVNLTDIIDINLVDNGGLTPTHALAAGSPALDALPQLELCSTATDQTGKDRPIDGNADGSDNCDIGAFENAKPDIIFKDGFEVL